MGNARRQAVNAVARDAGIFVQLVGAGVALHCLAIVQQVLQELSGRRRGGEDRHRPTGLPFSDHAGIVEGVAAELQKHPGLRVHQRRLVCRDAEELRVKRVDVGNDRRRRDTVRGRAHLRCDRFFQFLSREAANQNTSLDSSPPKCLKRGEARLFNTGQPGSHANNRGMSGARRGGLRLGRSDHSLALALFVMQPLKPLHQIGNPWLVKQFDDRKAQVMGNFQPPVHLDQLEQVAAKLKERCLVGR